MACVLGPANEDSSGAGFDVTINGDSTSEEREILKKTREDYEALFRDTYQLCTD